MLYCSNVFAHIGTIVASSLPFSFFGNLTFENIEEYIEIIQNYAEPLHVHVYLLRHFGRDKTESKISCVFYTLFILNQVYLILSKSSAG